jgi:hypothetical protein
MSDSAYMRPEILTLDSEDIIGHLGPAQGYGATERGESPFDTLAAPGKPGELRRLR